MISGDLLLLLSQRNYQALNQSHLHDRSLVRKLFSLLQTPDSLLRWRAIEALGQVAGQLAQERPERVRDLIRRLFWAMNDESGNLIRCAPEGIAEILVNAPVLIPEFAPLLPTFFHEEPFEAGAHWGVFRLTQFHPEIFRETIPELQRSICDPDPRIRAFSAAALLQLSGSAAQAQLMNLQQDVQTFEVYDFASGELRRCNVAQYVLEQSSTLGSCRG